MKSLLLILLFLPTIAIAQVKVRVINPTKYPIALTYGMTHHMIYVASYDTSAPLKYMHKIRSREWLQLWCYQNGKPKHVQTYRFRMHVEPITRGEWYLYIYPDHIDSTKWIVFPIPKEGVRYRLYLNPMYEGR